MAALRFPSLLYIYVTSIKWRVLWKILTYSPKRSSAVNHPTPPRVCLIAINIQPCLRQWGNGARCVWGRGEEFASVLVKRNVRFCAVYARLFFLTLRIFLAIHRLWIIDEKRLSKNRCRGFSFPQRWKKKMTKKCSKRNKFL